MNNEVSFLPLFLLLKATTFGAGIDLSEVSVTFARETEVKRGEFWRSCALQPQLWPFTETQMRLRSHISVVMTSLAP